MELKKLQEIQLKMMTENKWLPKNRTEGVLHLVEEVGEVCEVIRENSSKEDLEDELADVFFNLMKICWFEKIDLETAFMNKLDKINANKKNLMD